ncbi:MAG: FHA domain-containing protein [Clostridia bacterium]|nr:DUF6382 domain-containing protein [Lachnospiraceae bacterium]NCB99637.1 FHA domain-containing protein [Clostridia bacterium]NCD01841.1 FHA domain-containing protein [Clostridia bacterium]
MELENHRDKDLKNTYLWVDREGRCGEKYEENLLFKQKIPGLVSFYEVEENRSKGLVYVLNQKNSWCENLKNERMNCAHIEKFIKSLTRVMETVDEYLLDPSNLVMEMDYIFSNEHGWEYLYIPGYGKDFWMQLEKLAEEWLNWVDYGNEKAVLWAYTFYEKVHGSGCATSDFLEILQTEKRAVSTVREDIETAEEQKEPLGKGSNVDRSPFRFSEKVKTFFGRLNAKPDKPNDFYEEKTRLGDTSPILDIPEDLLGQRQFMLVPMGDNEQPVIQVEKYPYILGRAPEEVDGCVDWPQISRIHARLEARGQEIKIVDMSSVNGTFRNDEYLKPGMEYTLHTGDILKLADLEFICQF